MNIYVDGCFDLIHHGHINFLKHAKDKAIEKNSKLVVGIHNDKTVESYKRTPILTMEERAPLLESCKYVDQLVLNAPLHVTQEYIKKYNIGTMCIPDNRKQDEIDSWYNNLDISIVKLQYTTTISTTNIIKKLKDINEAP